MSGALTPEVIEVPVCVDADEIPKAPSDRDAIVAGCVVGAVFLIGFGGWAALAPLSSAAVAPGEIRVDSHRKTVQHMEDGIIRSILVREGDEVRQGQVLMQLDDTQAMANVTALEGQDYALLAEEARLTAERDNLPAVAFPLASSVHVPIRDSRRSARARRTSSLTARKSRWSGQHPQSADRPAPFRDRWPPGAAGCAAKANSNRRRRGEAREATRRPEPAAATAPPRLAATGGRARGRSGRAVREHRQGRARDRPDPDRDRNTLNQNNTDIANDLWTTQDQIVGVEEKLRAAADVERRNIHRCAAKRQGGGFALFHARRRRQSRRADPRHRAAAGRADRGAQGPPPRHRGRAQGPRRANRLVAFPNHNSPTVKGRVTEMSADTLDQQADWPVPTTPPRSSIDARELARLKDVKLYPGMPADVLIVTGRRTLLDYLLDPLRSSFSRAFRES